MTISSFMQKKRNLVWTCDCGEQQFFLLVTCEVECSKCGLISNGRWATPDKPDELIKVREQDANRETD